MYKQMYYRQMALNQSDLGYVDGLGTFLALNYIVLNSFALFKRLESFLIDSAEMNENIISFGIGNKSKTLLVIEPLDSSFAHYWHLQKQNILIHVLCTKKTMYNSHLCNISNITQVMTNVKKNLFGTERISVWTII